MTTIVNRKADFLQNESIRIDSHNESNRFESRIGMLYFREREMNKNKKNACGQLILRKISKFDMTRLGDAILTWIYVRSKADMTSPLNLPHGTD